MKGLLLAELVPLSPVFLRHSVHLVITAKLQLLFVGFFYIFLFHYYIFSFLGEKSLLFICILQYLTSTEQTPILTSKNPNLIFLCLLWIDLDTLSLPVPSSRYSPPDPNGRMEGQKWRWDCHSSTQPFFTGVIVRKHTLRWLDLHFEMVQRTRHYSTSTSTPLNAGVCPVSVPQP